MVTAMGSELRKNDMQALLDQHYEEKIKYNDNISNKNKRKDGFLNKKIRSLTVAAYLRCLYGAIEFAPTVTL